MLCLVQLSTGNRRKQLALLKVPSKNLKAVEFKESPSESHRQTVKLNCIFLLLNKNGKSLQWGSRQNVVMVEGRRM